ncbi:flagellar filament capping protein FliD [Cellulomonas fimi]|uniref:Flagellar hook-associated protein 2 n=1 Tax=Cellulomonas fimi (strain ATCC 484 / DSM 20113 / JCM 1341 / CCUG 24087 / LMG 16345 / NBRC 15513 / NCIMB 8980 / NCTC 7547 / NRS-133) TaxID=590998 RepID=F4GYT6_CELFA|nr:flagellar filament capping protein FliD [Cellulomonas fimi]AEE44805.1 flagellar hook-associated 2 domain-containing protein [Cellulomonas fimi ATCC 484]NNH08379.1 flagellar filament capping protein FliD [Cellulomonas fimi]VEH27339.1 Flagellar cap protein [Cellulomonas fimi]
MAALGIDGLISGLKTTDLIAQLMQVESAPQTLLKSKQTATTNLATALQSLNTKVASLAEAATKATTPASWTATKATSSATSVSATTSATSTPTQLSFTVDTLAASQVSLATYSDLTAAGTLAFRVDGKVTEVAIGTDAAATARAVSASGAGVDATVVTANGTTYLQLTGKTSGEAHAFEVFRGTKAQVEAGTATAVVPATIRDASDAHITLWKGTAAQQTATSSSNTFSDVLDGTSITVSKVETEAVRLTVETDTAALTSLASGLVGALNVVLSDIASRTASTTSTAADGGTVVTGGLLSGDSAVRDLKFQLQSAASYGVDGVSPSTVGIVIGKDGSFTFDQAKFTAALAADPGQVQKVVSGLAQRVADVATGASDPVEGTLTLKITGQQKLVKDLGVQIDDWDRRLAIRKESLQRTYSALEVTLSNLNSQSSWLAGQLSSLSASS